MLLDVAPCPLGTAPADAFRAGLDAHHVGRLGDAQRRAVALDQPRPQVVVLPRRHGLVEQPDLAQALREREHLRAGLLAVEFVVERDHGVGGACRSPPGPGVQQRAAADECVAFVEGLQQRGDAPRQHLVVVVDARYVAAGRCPNRDIARRGGTPRQRLAEQPDARVGRGKSSQHVRRVIRRPVVHDQQLDLAVILGSARTQLRDSPARPGCGSAGRPTPARRLLMRGVSRSAA